MTRAIKQHRLNARMANIVTLLLSNSSLNINFCFMKKTLFKILNKIVFRLWGRMTKTAKNSIQDQPGLQGKPCLKIEN